MISAGLMFELTEYFENIDGVIQLKAPLELITRSLDSQQIVCDDLYEVSGTEVIEELSGDELKYTILVADSDGVFTEKYIVAGELADSAGYTESNDLADLANLENIFSEPTAIKIRVYFHSEGTTTPQLSEAVIEYDWAVLSPILHKTIVWGFIGDAKEGVEVQATLNRPGKYNNVMIKPEASIALTDSRGYWELELVDTETMGNAFFYIFDFDFATKISYKRRVPKVSQINFVELTLNDIIT